MAAAEGRTLAGAGTAAAIAAVIAAATWAMAEQGVAAWEVTVGRQAFDLPSGLTPMLEVVMQAGTRAAPVVAAVAAAAALGWRWRAGGVAAAGLLAWAAAHVGTAVVDRPRPTQDLLDRAPRDVLTNAGYPSSHAAVATAVAVALVVLGRPRRWVAAVLGAAAALTAVARVHLGVHWALDVAGGAAIGALVALAVAAAVGIPPAGAVQRAGRQGELLVATFNIRNGRAWDGWSSWPFRSRSTARMARQLGADVLAVQEAYAFQARFLDAALPGYQRVGRGRNRRGGEWCAVYVRTDRLRVVSADNRWFGDQPELPGSRLPDASFPRVATHVRLADVDSGAELDVINTHLDERRPANRLRSAEQLVTWLRPETPTVVVGDLNATWAEQPELFAVLTAAGLVDAVPRDAGGTAHGFKGGIDHRRIDHIFVSHHWSVLDAAVVADERRRRLPSDHWPVVARLVPR